MAGDTAGSIDTWAEPDPIPELAGPVVPGLRECMMAELLVESGDFATDSVLILAHRGFPGPMLLRFTFRVTANPDGFVARALPIDGSDLTGVGAVIRGVGVQLMAHVDLPAGEHVFQIEPLGGPVASRYAILVLDPNEPPTEGGAPDDGGDPDIVPQPVLPGRPKPIDPLQPPDPLKPLQTLEIDERPPGYPDSR